MDAAELLNLNTGQKVSWLRIVDECSGSVLWTEVFPLGQWCHVPPTATQSQLRLAFTRWGRPGRIRVDNGTPWGAARGDLPTDLGLWLIGLGVGLGYNPPATPQNNGVVERSQGTAKRWAEPGTCQSVEELQGRLALMDEIQRRRYPSIQGRSRLQAYPAVTHSGRDYTADWEERNWSFEAAGSHLSKHVGRRLVGASGSISVYNRPVYVGAVHNRKSVNVMFDPGTLEWLIADDRGLQLGRRRAGEITRDQIMAMTVTRRS